MSENERHAMSLTYGPREDLLLKELDRLGDEKKITKNKNEILRRGLYTCRYLSETDEKRLLFSLNKILKSLSKDLDRTVLQFAESTSFSILSIMIAKYGLSKADTFQTIPMNLRMFDQILEKGIKKNQVEEGIKQEIKKLADSIETVFLSPSEMTKYDVGNMEKMIEVIKDNFYDKFVGKEGSVIGTNVVRKAVIKAKGRKEWEEVVGKKKSKRYAAGYKENVTFQGIKRNGTKKIIKRLDE